MNKPNTIDLDKLAKQLLGDLEAFKDDGVDHQITVMYLYQAFKLGDKHGWWQDLDDPERMVQVESQVEEMEDKIKVEKYNGL